MIFDYFSEGLLSPGGSQTPMPSFQPSESVTLFTLNGALEYLDQMNLDQLISRFFQESDAHDHNADSHKTSRI
jgi:hypothetical protein